MIDKALEGAGIGVVICGSDGAILYTSPWARLLAGSGDAGGLKKEPAHIREFPGDLEDLVGRIARGEEVGDMAVAMPGKPSPRHVVVSSSHVPAGRGEGSGAVVFVIRPAPSIVRGDEKWHEIIDSLDEGFYEVDLRGIMTFVNLEMSRIAGYERDEILGKKYDMFFTPEEASRIYGAFNEAYRTGVSNKLIDWEFRDGRGRTKRLESSISLIRDADGKITGFRGIVRDHTVRRRIEKELMRARKLEAIGILAGGIAHDFNNALTAILGNISLAKMEVPGENGGLMEVLNDAEEASLRAVELTRRLATFAKGGRPERKIIDYTDSLRATVDSAMQGYQGKYELIIRDRLREVDMDESQVGQVITYMIANAMESMENGGTIRITAENVAVEEEKMRDEISLQPGDYVRISIQDKGKGMTPEQMQNIFDPYYTTKPMASGMGLTTSYAIIKRHHGYIDVESAPGKGSTVHVYLPAAGEEHHDGEDIIPTE
ncbi:MAG: PAS domain S-box protein [Spirochaetes bacterium]|nr:PAS domain S-box protein [Spirochaetota bacterium]